MRIEESAFLIPKQTEQKIMFYIYKENISMSEQTTNDLPEKAVIGLQVSSEQKEYYEQFKERYGYQTLSNAVKVHLKVASKVFEKSPKEFFEYVDSSNLQRT